MLQVGRLCLKIAGRDSNRTCIIIDVIDKNFVLIDGDVRRKKCNMRHLEPTGKTIKIKKGASHEEIEKEFKKLNLKVWSKKPKEKKEQVKEEKPKKKEVKEGIKKK